MSKDVQLIRAHLLRILHKVVYEYVLIIHSGIVLVDIVLVDATVANILIISQDYA